MTRKKEENFETSMRELEQIVTRLEAGGLELDDSLKLFEKGTALFARCNRMLDSAQTRLDVLFEESGQWEVRDAASLASTYTFADVPERDADGDEVAP